MGSDTRKQQQLSSSTAASKLGDNLSVIDSITSTQPAIDLFDDARFKRFVLLSSAGGDPLNDHELIDLLFSTCCGDRVERPAGKDLILMYGGINPMMSAAMETLLREGGLSLKEASLLQIIHKLMSLALAERIKGPPILGSWSALLNYLRVALAAKPVEQLNVLYLDAQNGLIRDEVLHRGTVDRVHLYARDLVKRALELNACALILVHNHPGGNPSPSKSDIQTTKEAVKALSAIGITVHDHVIVGRDGEVSMRSLRSARFIWE